MDLFHQPYILCLLHATESTGCHLNHLAVKVPSVLVKIVFVYCLVTNHQKGLFTHAENKKTAHNVK